MKKNHLCCQNIKMSASVAENKLNSSGWLQIIEIKSQVLKLDLKNQQKHEFEFSRAWEIYSSALLMIKTTDYGRPIKPFFSKILTFWAWADNFGAFGVFSADLSAPILVLWVPCPCFPLINHFFYKNISFWFQFQFGQQRIRDLAIMRP